MMPDPPTGRSTGTGRPNLTRNGAGLCRGPGGWRRLGSRGFGPFVTRETYRLPDGDPPLVGLAVAPQACRTCPRRIDLVGPVLHGLVDRRSVRHRLRVLRAGLVPALRHRRRGDAGQHHLFHRLHLLHDGLFLQYMEVASAPSTLVEPHRNGLASLLRIRHRRIDWWAAAIQLIGTVWFNRTTLSALLVGLGASRPTTRCGARTRWAPFASCVELAGLAEECHGSFAWQPSSISWWITALNLAGSVAFGVSAIASYVTSGGQLLSLA